MLNRFAPLIAIAQPSSCPPPPISARADTRIQLKARCLRAVTLPVTHLVQKPLPMRHKTSTHPRNQLKQRALQPHEYELHTPGNTCVTFSAPRPSGSDSTGRFLCQALTPCHPNLCGHPRVTHLAKRAPKMRHPTSTIRRN
jgi:hypothetical protein